MRPVDGFGQALRAQRAAAGMRQADLVEVLDHVIARSTLANVEVGRENPSARLWEAICAHLPHWVPELEPHYTPRSPAPSGFADTGPFDIVHATDAYTFRDHRSAEELIQVRRLRARTHGASRYVMRLINDSAAFDIDIEPLWGGWVERHERSSSPHGIEHRFHVRLDHPLDRGEEGEFAMRSWLLRDVADNAISMSFSLPTTSASLSATFAGNPPRRLWGIETDDDLPSRNIPVDDERLLPLSAGGNHTLRIRRPVPLRVYGIGWSW